MHKKSIAAALVVAALSSATVLASADAAPAAADQDRAGHYQVTAGVYRSEVLLGSTVKIAGSVAPASPGSEVTIQVRYADRASWKTIGHAWVSRQGRYRFKDVAASVRERRYRVVKPRDARHSAGRGTTQPVVVYGWRDLTTLDPASATGFGETQVTMNAVGYPASLRLPASALPPGATSATTDYNLNRGCTAFRGVVGLDDSSPSGGSAQIQLTTDGALRSTGSFGLTQTSLVAFDVTDVFRLSITATPSGGGVAAVGTPQVLCRF